MRHLPDKHMPISVCRNAYNMVINKFGDRLYGGLVETITRHLESIAQKVEATQGDGFLRELKLRWNNHNKSMQMIRDILMVGAHARTQPPRHSGCACGACTVCGECKRPDPRSTCWQCVHVEPSSSFGSW